MNGRSFQHSKNSPSSRRKQRLSTPVLLAACLSLFASSSQAYPRTSTLESGLVIESLSVTSTLSLSGLQTGDVIRHWEPLLPHLEAERQPYSLFDWFWFTNELLPRCPMRVTFEREEKFFDTIIFQGTIGARVRPVLPKADLLFYIRFSQLLSNNSASEAARLAEEFFDQQRGEGTDLLSWASFLAATAYEQSKDLPKAIEWYLKAIDSTQDPLEQIYIWQSIGIVHQGARQPREAESAYKRALAISQASWPGSLIETTSIRALYLLAWESRDVETVRTYVLREAEILAREAPNSLKLADSWNMLGVLGSRAGEKDQAKAYHQQGLSIYSRPRPKESRARMIIGLSFGAGLQISTGTMCMLLWIKARKELPSKSRNSFSREVWRLCSPKEI
jgi:tetratricopeptide (TPR) repeat protein